MSKTVDERVVSMQFDNKQFESNVQTTMSTLDKLKKSLNLSGAAKGFDEINSSANKVNLSGVGSAVETVRTKFSALQVMGVTALANITNSAVNSGKKMVSALTLDPVRAGFQEYETQMNAVQTILANTQKEGTNVKIVNGALDELNTYADKTIYNFTEMTRNIGTFTAAGVKLDTSVEAIQGIANLAAVSGSTSQQASTAMYQLSQALAAGTVKLQDWNSIVNAGMGGQVFQEALKETSRELNTGVDNAIKAKGSFRESLQLGWMTSEVLTKTLKKFTTSGASEYVAKYTGLSKKAVEQELESAKAKYGEAKAIEYASKALAKKSGKNEKEIKQTLQFAKTAEDAATKVKTFSQLMDTLKEALGSGWTTTWRLIIGDFDQAKELFTKISDFLGGFIDKMSDARNAVLKSALGKSFKSMGKNLTTMIEPAKKAVETVEKLGDVVDKVILGKFGKGQERFDALTKSGHNYYRVQNKVNETLGNSFRYTDKQIRAQDKLLNSQNGSIKGTKEESKATTKLTKEKKELLKSVASMTEEQMRSKGYKDEQIEAFKELGETADKLGMPVNKFIDNMDKINGRWLMLKGFENIGKSILAVFKTIGKAWDDVFPPKSTKEKSDQLFNLIAAFHKFSTSLKMNKETANDLRRTFRGLFAILDLVTTFAGGGLKLAFKAVNTVLGMFGLNILSVTAAAGDAVVKFRDWVKENNILVKGLEIIVTYLKRGAEAAKKWFDGLKDADNIPEYIIQGLVNGLKSGVVGVAKAALEIGKSILETIKSFLEIHSPSKKMEEVGTFAVQGLVNGLLNGIEWIVNGVKKIASIIGNAFNLEDLDFKSFINAISKALTIVFDAFVVIFSNIFNFIKSISSKIVGVFGEIDFGTAFAGLISGGYVATIYKLAKAIESLSKPIEGLGDVLEGAGNVLKNFPKVMRAFAFELRTEGLKNMAVAIAILVASIAVLTYLDADEVDHAVSVVIGLSLALVGLSIAMDKMSKAAFTISKNGPKLQGMKTGLIAIGVAVLLLAATVKMIGTLKPEQAKQGFIGLAKLVGAIAVVFLAFGLFVNNKKAENIDKAGKMIRKMATTLLLMVVVVKLIGMLKQGELDKGAIFIAGFIRFVLLLSIASRFAGTFSNDLGKMLIAMSVSMLLLVGVFKLIGQLSPGEAICGIIALGVFLGFVYALVGITKIAKGQEIAKVGTMLLAVSSSMLILAIVVKMIAKMEWDELKNGLKGIAVLGAVIAGLIAVVKKCGSDIPKIAMTLMSISIAISILAVTAIILGMVDLEALKRGIAAVGALGIIMALMIAATRGANDCKGNLIVMTVAIGIMTAAVIALSLIDPTKLAGATAALSMVMGMFALIIKSASSVNSSLAVLIVMTLAVAALGGIIYLLAGLPIESTIAAAASLSMLLLSLSISMTIISKIGTMTPMALVSVVTMTLIVSALGGILYLLSGIPVDSTMGVAKALSILLLSMSASMLILSVVGAMGPAALIGIASLMALIVGVGGLVMSIGALVTKFPMLEEFLNKGIPILESIGHALGSFFGNIISGFVDGASECLPKLGLTLSQFMTNSTPFIVGAKMIDTSVMDGVKALAEAVLILTGANLLESLTSWLTGGSSLADFGKELAEFGPYMAAYAASVSGIDAEAVKASASAAKALAEMTSYIPKSEGVVQWFAGETSISKFASELPILGAGLMAFSLSVANIKPEAITAAANAAKSLAQMTNEIPKSEGVVQWFAGETSISKFGDELPKLGEGLKGFSDNVNGVKPEAITAAANAAKSLAQMTNEIPKEGGVTAWFSGENSISKFGDELPELGKGLKGFSDNVNGISAETVTAAAGAAKSLAQMASYVPKKGGLEAWFSGENSVSSFADELPKLGEGLKGFSDSLKGMSAENVTAASAAAKNLAKISKYSPENAENLVTFGEKAKEFGGKLSKYFESVSGVTSLHINASNRAVEAIKKAGEIDTEKVTSASVAADKMVKMVKNMSGIDEKAAEGFANSLKSFDKKTIDNFVKAFSDAGPKLSKCGTNLISAFTKSISKQKQKMYNAGEKAVSKFAEGVKDHQDKIDSSFSKMMDKCVEKIKSKYDGFYKAGSYVVSGFANGISENDFKAVAKAKAMAKKAKKAAAKELDEHSPSKEFYKIGDFAGQGFVNALGDYEKKSYKASSEVAKSAKKGLSKAVSNVGKMLNGEMDAQPTIRPVLDLTNVKSVARSINGIFGNGVSIGVSSNLNAINSAMNKRQNGNLDSDLLSAVNGLRDDFAASANGVNVEVNLDYNASSDANQIANDIAVSLRRAIRRGV